ncbi:hypothetical protein I7I50_07290 [Histoplasma capsulatum G186AR]|uniref:Uncharacterized protein n=1 Tax=Ajellomyces capsulatus TaxID=5037 RepID=A0A8H8D2I7_AJECA|nr:hypothetical protein I7I52_09638 [Histoplasma capsulatum]QSS68023.1 hypothetical protein I7I50_07290 [Histoplasma capsulatum G186AR]
MHLIANKTKTSAPLGDSPSSTLVQKKKKRKENYTRRKKITHRTHRLQGWMIGKGRGTRAIASQPRLPV